MISPLELEGFRVVESSKYMALNHLEKPLLPSTQLQNVRKKEELRHSLMLNMLLTNRMLKPLVLILKTYLFLNQIMVSKL